MADSTACADGSYTNLQKSYFHVQTALKLGYRVDLATAEIYSPFGKRLACTPSKLGYKTFSVRTEGKYLRVYVHKMVAFFVHGQGAFMRGVDVRHKDNNKLNNLPENIWIGTRQENILDRDPKERSETQKKALGHLKGQLRPGLNVPGRKLTFKQARKIYARVHAGEKPTALAREYGVDSKSIRNIRDGKAYRDAFDRRAELIDPTGRGMLTLREPEGWK
jgi:hypothetical protein